MYYWYKKNYNKTPSINNNLYYFSNNTSREAFMTFFKLPFAGYRNNSNASLNLQGSDGRYWSSSPSSAGSNYALHLYLDSSNVFADFSYYRAYGYSVRCFKDEYVAKVITYNPNG